MARIIKSSRVLKASIEIMETYFGYLIIEENEEILRFQNYNSMKLLQN